MAEKRKSALRGFDGSSEMTADTPQVSEFEEDDLGRFSDARSARLLASSVIRTAELAWSTDLVRVRLREAARGCERLVRKPGPRSRSGFWPDPALFATEVAFSDAVTALQIASKADPRASAPLAHFGAGGDREIARIEEALCWPIQYLAAPEHEAPRKALQMWMWCEAKNEAFGEFFKALGCSRRTAYRRRDAALETILAGVIRDRLRP
jgi:hypothetical protein